MIRQDICGILGISFLLLSHNACSMTDDIHKDFPDSYDLVSDQVTQGNLVVTISDVFAFDAVEIGKLADAAGRGDMTQMEQIVARGVSVNGIGQRAMTPLLWALGKRNMIGFQWLLEHGADPNLVSCCDIRRPKLSPMAMAAQGDDSRFLETLLGHGGNPNLIVDDAERTPIFFAVGLRRTHNIELLVQHHADLNQVSLSDISIMAFGQTPLQSAFSSGQYEIALLLLNLGADPCTKDRSGHTLVGKIRYRGNSGTTQGDREAFPKIVEHLKPFACS